MRPEGVAAAQRELKRARRAAIRFQSFYLDPEETEEAEDLYDAFLTHAGRIYEKLRAACHGQGLDWMWWRKQMDQRRDNQLLLYIHKARNTETHRLEPSGVWLPPNRALPQMLHPLPVTDRDGNVYFPPTKNFSSVVRPMDVETIMRLGGSYLHSLVEEAASRVR
jgi:hypothetical protein